MKVKNIAFSGFAAMIFAGLCGAADAASASVNLASKSYVDEQLESKANLIDLETLQTTVGQKATQESLNKVATQVNQNTTDIAELMGREHLTSDDLTLLRNELLAKINEMHKLGDYATAESLQAVSESLATLKGDVYTKAEVDKMVADAISGGNINLDGYAKTSDLDALIELIGANSDRITALEQAGYQTAGEVSTAIGAATANLASKTELNAKQNVINADNMLSSDFVSGLATVATSGQYADLQGKPDIPSIEGLATKQALTNLQSTLQAAIDEKQAKGSYADADALEALQETVQSLQNGAVDKETVENLQTSVETIAADYAKKSELTSTEQNLQAAINGVKDLIPTVPTNVSAFNNDAGYQTAGDVSTAIGTATANLASKTELNAKQNVINADNMLSSDFVSGLAPVATTGSYESLTDKPTIPSTDNLATKDELNAKQNVINADNMLSSDFVSGLATVATTGSYESLTDKPTIPSTDNLVTKDELDDLQTALQAKIDEKQALGEYATAESLQAVSESLATLEGDVYTKAEVDAKIAEVASGGNIDLDGYAKTSDLDALTALVNGNTAEINTLKSAGYQTSTQVSEAISTATSGLVTSEALDAMGFLDAASIATGTENGTIAVNGTDVPVQGLGSAAYTESSDYLVGPTPVMGTNFLQATCTNKSCKYKFVSYDDVIDQIKADAGVGEL